MPNNNTRLVQQTRRDGHKQGYHRKNFEMQSEKPDRDAFRAERAKVTPGDWSTRNAAPEFVPETLWGRVKREYRALRAHARNWADRMAERAANNAAARRIMREQDAGNRILWEADHQPARAPMSDAEEARFIAEGELFRETLEWRRKTGRNMLTGEHLSGMPIDEFGEFPDSNPFNEGGTLKFNRRPLDEEEGRPFDLKKFDPVTGKFKGRLPKGADPYRDEHGRNARGRYPDGRDCHTGSLFDSEGKSEYGYSRDQYFKEVILEGLTPEEAAAHRADQEAFTEVLYVDAKEREWAERYA